MMKKKLYKPFSIIFSFAFLLANFSPFVQVTSAATPPATTCAILTQLPDYGGGKVAIRKDEPDITEQGPLMFDNGDPLDDGIESISIGTGVTVTIYKGIDFSGPFLVITVSQDRLGNLSYNDGSDVDARVGSIRVSGGGCGPTAELISPLDGRNRIDRWVTGDQTFVARVTDVNVPPLQARATFHFVPVVNGVDDNMVIPNPDKTPASYVNSGSNSNWVSSGLSNGKMDWQAKATNTAGDTGSFTSTWRVKVDKLVPNTPTCTVSSTGLITTNPVSDQIPTNGTPSGIASGRLQRSTDNVSYSNVATGTTFNGTAAASGEEYQMTLGTKTFQDTGLVSGTTYHYRFSVTDGAGRTSGNGYCGNTGGPPPVPGFTIICTNTYMGNPCQNTPVIAGTTVTFDVFLHSVNGFSSNNVILDQTGLPGGSGGAPLFCGFMPSRPRFVNSPPVSSPPDDYCPLEITPTIPGDYPFTITASSSSPAYTAAPINGVLHVIAPVASPRFEVIKGDVGSFGRINAGTSETEFLAISSAIDSINFISTKNWLVENYSNLSVKPPVTASIYDSMGPPTSTPVAFTDDWVAMANRFTSANGKVVIYQDSGWAGNGTYTGPATVVFIKGNFYISKDLNIAADKGLIFVIDGNLNIDQAVKNVDGVYLVTKNVVTNGIASPGCPAMASTSNQLTIHGAIYSANSPCLNRSLIDNDLGPAETIIYEPKYLWLFRDILGHTRNFFSEQNP